MMLHSYGIKILQVPEIAVAEGDVVKVDEVVDE
jgi:hypothetical protein